MNASLSAYTCVISTRDDDSYLSEAIASVLDQTHAPSQVLIVVNPGSSHDSGAARVARSFGEGVRILESALPGLIAGLNAGIESTTSDYIAFLDSDDLWSPEKQKLQISQLSKDASLDASTSAVTNFRDCAEGVREFVQTAPGILFTATTFRTDAFSRFGALDPSATHHTWLARWWSNARANNIRLGKIDSVGVLRRIHSDNSWVVDSTRAHEDLRKELRSILRRKREYRTH